MTYLSKVVWNEGMHLAQHHLQAQSRYFESAIQFALSHLFFSAYGLAGLELDAEALRNGTVSLIHARGVMPDGLPFHIPEGDPVPDPLDIRELFSPTHDSHLVLLAIPPYRRDGSNYALERNGSRTTQRYVAETALVPDETTGRDAKPVKLGRKNLRLLLDAEADDGAVALPLARVRRDGTGRFVYDPEYIPPCLQIGASERIMHLLRRTVEILDAKSAALGAQRQGRAKSIADYASNEVASFWLLHTINSSLAPLRHHLLARRARPEELYTELTRLGGALCTFALDSHPRALPPYTHGDLERTFGTLDRHIREHLEIIIPTRCVQVPLQAVTAYLHTGAVADKRCFGRAQWIFGIRSTAGAAELITRVPQLVKVCSARFTPELVRRAYPGLKLEHVPSPPAAISPRIGTQYFSISKTGPCWDTLISTAQVGVYVPDAFPEPELELKVLLEE
jgi:type VI secretion system protein ImpJ